MSDPSMIFEEIRRLGGSVAAEGHETILVRPSGVLTPELRAAILEQKPLLIAILLRAEAFRRQITAWAAAGRPGVPTLVLPDAPAPKAGRCISCGAVVMNGWRCGICRAAVNAALDMPAVGA